MGRYLFATLSALSLVLPFSTASAQTWPDKPIRVIVPYGPGGVDGQLRLAQPFIEPLLGQVLLIENRAGAGAIVGTTAVRNAAPDGYTLLFTGTSALSVIPHMRKVEYRMDDFVPIGTLSATSLIVVAPTGAPFKTLAEAIAYAKKNPAKLNYGSSGVGTTIHMVGLALQVSGGIEFTHVPYTGMAQTITGMLSGGTHLTIGIPSAFMGQVKGGTLRVIGSTGNQRSEFVPDAPTLKEAGLNVVEETKFGLLAPKGTPASVVSKVANALNTAVQNKEFVGKMRGGFVTPLFLDQAAFAATLRQEEEYWSAMLKRPQFKSVLEN
jgi:tripartite-type tricarboxylate transporter receptor subunit TctC